MMRLQILVTLALLGSVSGLDFAVTACTDAKTCGANPPTCDAGYKIDVTPTKKAHKCMSSGCTSVECCVRVKCKYTVPDAAKFKGLQKIGSGAVTANDNQHTLNDVNVNVACADGKWTNTHGQSSMATAGTGVVTTCTAAGGDFVFTGCELNAKPHESCHDANARLLGAGGCAAGQFIDTAKAGRCTAAQCTKAECCVAKAKCDSVTCPNTHTAIGAAATTHCAGAACTNAEKASTCCTAKQCKATAAQIAAAGMQGNAIGTKGAFTGITCRHCGGYAGKAAGVCTTDNGDFTLSGCTKGSSCTAKTDAALNLVTNKMTRTAASGCVSKDAATYVSQFVLSCTKVDGIPGSITCGGGATATSGAFPAAVSMVALIGAFFLY